MEISELVLVIWTDDVMAAGAESGKYIRTAGTPLVVTRVELESEAVNCQSGLAPLPHARIFRLTGDVPLIANSM